MPPNQKKSIKLSATSAASVVFNVDGKMSTFGGPDDHGVGASEGLALFDKRDLSNPKYADLFLPAPPPGTSGLARRLNPAKNYLACRWNYDETSHDFLRNSLALVENPQNRRKAYARPVDWGPKATTGRVADLSPGLAAFLGLDTDDDVSVSISRESTAGASVADEEGGHGSNNPHPKPLIKEFIQSPNYSSRNGAKIEMIVLHCTEGSLQSTIATFKNPGGRQVSAHYVIDRNGDIYQMVSDSDRANHCKGANQNSIGIEHVATSAELLAIGQTKASASLIRWLLEQYDIPRASVYGHDFTPGYSGGGTSCPDKLFGSAHSQQAVADWVARNV